MLRLISTLPILLLSLGCVVTVHDSDPDPVPPLPPAEEAPFIEWADAGCYWSAVDRDFVWWFEADVFDTNGFDDVSAVYADVLDWDGQFVDSFELYQNLDDKIVWGSAWFELSTWLDCRYPDYIVEFLAYDWLGGVDVLDVTPLVY